MNTVPHSWILDMLNTSWLAARKLIVCVLIRYHLFVHASRLVGLHTRAPRLHLSAGTRLQAVWLVSCSHLARRSLTNSTLTSAVQITACAHCQDTRIRRYNDSQECTFHPATLSTCILLSSSLGGAHPDPTSADAVTGQSIKQACLVRPRVCSTF